MSAQKALPFSIVTLVFGALSIPLAFARHLVSLSLVLALLSISLVVVGRLLARKRSYSETSLKRSKIGLRCAVVGAICSVTMWWLWASNIMLDK
ncbi:MAG: hypothetical protein KA230_03290 [Flavobacteriales bacterium]|nr:hypothetical protein [Flavobacteriales bacterium]